MPERKARDPNAASLPKPLATAQEIADHCRVPLETVYAWSSRGGGPKLIKVGRHLRARWADVESWLDEQTVNAA